MYAIVEIAGQQIKVAKDQKVYVHRLPGEEGDTVSFDKVLLIGDGDTITLGAPAIDGALIGAKVVKHLKGDKVIVFKKKRRKGYRKKNGHRQYLTQILIESIVTSGGKKEDAKASKSTSKTETKPAAPAKAKKEVVQDSNNAINTEKLLNSLGTAVKKDADDLTLISGIGPVYQEKLNELGIYTFEQISKLKAADRQELSAIDGITREKIEAEEWVKQAKELLKNK